MARLCAAVMSAACVLVAVPSTAHAAEESTVLLTGFVKNSAGQAVPDVVLTVSVQYGAEGDPAREIGWGYSWPDGSFDTWIAYPDALEAAREADGRIPLTITSPTDTGKVFTTFHGHATLGDDGVLRPSAGDGGDKFALTLDGKAAVIGYDEDGDPVYSTADPLETDPVEAGDVPVAGPYSDVDEVEDPAPAPPAKSGARAAGDIYGPCVPRHSVTVRDVKNNVKFDYGVTLRNGKSQTANLTVTAKKTTTYTMGTSATVSASAKAWIFAEAKAEITGSISMQKSTEYGETVSVPVPRYSSVTVDRGMVHERFTYTYSSSDYACKTKRGSGTAWAPRRVVWNVH